MIDYLKRIELIATTCLSLAVVMCCFWLVLVPNDPMGGFRYVMLRIIALCVAIPAVAIGWRLLDWCNPGRWFDEDPKPFERTAILCALLLVIGYVIVGA
jgi:hypothetical protein